MADRIKAIKDLAAAGHTRKDIRAIMNITSEDITDVLGKDPRGRKPKVSVKVEVEVEVLPTKTKKRGPGRPKGSKNKKK